MSLSPKVRNNPKENFDICEAFIIQHLLIIRYPQLVMASLSEIGSSAAVTFVKCRVKSVGLNGGVLASRFTLAMVLATTPAPHSVRIMGFRLP